MADDVRTRVPAVVWSVWVVAALLLLPVLSSIVTLVVVASFAARAAAGHAALDPRSVDLLAFGAIGLLLAVTEDPARRVAISIGGFAVIGPATILYLLLRVTGIPLTEEQALRSRGEAYRHYQKTTSSFIPWFPKKS